MALRPQDPVPVDPARVAAVLAENGGIAGRAALLDVMSRWELERLVLAGSLVRLARGQYVAPGVVDAREASRRAALSLSGVVSGLSAARWWGWGVKRDPPQPVITVPRDRVVSAARRAGIVVQRRDLRPEAVADGVVLSRAATVVDCARRLPFDEALCVADSARREGRVGVAQLTAAALASPRTGRARALRVVEASDPRPANAFESLVRAPLLSVDDLRLQPQLWIDDWRVDLGDRDLKIVVECESWAHHGSADGFRRDIRRYTTLTSRGWLVVRFVWEDAMQHPDLIRTSVERLVSLRRTDTQFAAVLRARGASGGVGRPTGCR